MHVELWWEHCVWEECCDCLFVEEKCACKVPRVCQQLSSAGLSCQSVFDSSVPRVSPFGREVAVRNSPSKLVPQLKLSSSSCHIVVAVAENDSPEFRKQSEEYYKVSATDRAWTLFGLLYERNYLLNVEFSCKHSAALLYRFFVCYCRKLSTSAIAWNRWQECESWAYNKIGTLLKELRCSTASGQKLLGVPFRV